MPNPRVLKLADQIKSIVAQMLEKRIKDPRLGFVTITDVRLTGDSREATVFYTVYGDEAARAGTAAALKSATGLIRSTVGKRLGLRYAPSIAFVLDALPDTAASIEDLLARAQAGDAALAEQRENATYAGEADPYRRKDEDEDGEVGESGQPGPGQPGPGAPGDETGERDDDEDPAHQDDQADAPGPVDPSDLFERD
ncbi:30S ribosome-binding factor RbfA [Raineyella fluvialis]|uniref:Ribosome-binding factor A n=1 Tax=Raineyella fluvialis TaxID=2662261 RepID=A0A5Q2FEV9_9ACTN|nr:30S ribosome-binding factor RbfA [Raineyella fluvialis]